MGLKIVKSDCIESQGSLPFPDEVAGSASNAAITPENTREAFEKVFNVGKPTDPLANDVKEVRGPLLNRLLAPKPALKGGRLEEKKLAAARNMQDAFRELLAADPDFMKKFLS